MAENVLSMSVTVFQHGEREVMLGCGDGTLEDDKCLNIVFLPTII